MANHQIFLPIKVSLNPDELKLTKTPKKDGLILDGYSQKRLKERFPYLSRLELTEIIWNSTFVDRSGTSSAERVKRLIRHGFVETKYLINKEKDICFVLPVVNGEVRLIKTVYQESTSWRNRELNDQVEDQCKKPLSLKDELFKTFVSDVPDDKLSLDAKQFLKTFIEEEKDYEFLAGGVVFVLNYTLGLNLLRALGAEKFSGLPCTIVNTHVNKEAKVIRLGKIGIRYDIDNGKLLLKGFSRDYEMCKDQFFQFLQNEQSLTRLNFKRPSSKIKTNYIFNFRDLPLLTRLKEIMEALNIEDGQLHSSSISHKERRQQLTEEKIELFIKLNHKFTIEELNQLVSKLLPVNPT